MAKEHRDASKSKRPETEPYAPPKHPDVHVPEQQYEGERKQDPQRKSH